MLFYGNSGEAIQLEDRVLAHAKVVIATKLRRSESFTLSWTHSAGEPGGRSTIWLHPSIPLRFQFESTENEKLDPTLLSEMAKAASSASGLVLGSAGGGAELKPTQPTAASKLVSAA